MDTPTSAAEPPASAAMARVPALPAATAPSPPPPTAPLHRRRPSARHVVVALLVLALVGYAGRDLLLGKRVPTFVAQSSPLTQTVVASGRVITPERVTIGSQITGRVARVPVVEGQQVAEGQVLIELDDQDESAAVAQATAAVAQAHARLRQLSEVDRPSAVQAFQQADTAAGLADRRLARATDLRAQGLISQSDFDDALSAQRDAASRLRAAAVQVAATRLGGANEQLAQSSLQQALASLALARANLGHTTIRAPGAGTLIARSVESGDVVQPGHELMALAVSGGTQLDVQIDEKNLAQLSLGQSAFASADAFPDRRFPAKLFYINPGVDALRGSVEVKLDVARPPAYLRQDMTVSVEIEVAHRERALTVPAEAVRDEASGHPYVLVLRGHRAERQEVKLGLRGQGRVEIVEGLAEGDRAIPAVEGQIVLPGDRVRSAND